MIYELQTGKVIEPADGVGSYWVENLLPMCIRIGNLSIIFLYMHLNP